MNDRARARYERAQRVDTFSKGIEGDFAPGSIAANLLAEHATLVPEVDKAKATQRRTRDTGKEILVDALRLDLLGIAATARVIARHEPGFADNYRMPDGPGEGVLLTAGDAMLRNLNQAGVAQKFIDREMPADFVQDLAADLRAIRSYKDTSEGGREDSVEATAAVNRLCKRSGEIVQEVGPMMRNKYSRTAPDKLRRWLSASHLERQPRSKNDPGSEPTPEETNDHKPNGAQNEANPPKETGPNEAKESDNPPPPAKS